MTDLQTEEVFYGIVTSTSFSLLGTLAVIYSYIRYNRLRRHPANIVLIRCVLDFLFCLQMLVNHLVHRSNQAAQEEDCRPFTFINEFLTISAELWSLMLSFDLFNAMTNPFTNITSNLRRYHLVSWSIALLFSILTITLTRNGNHIYARDPLLDICWIRREDDAHPGTIDPYLVILYILPVLTSQVFSLFMLFVTSRRLRHGLPGTLKARVHVFRNSSRFVASYLAYWFLAAIVYLILYALKSDTTEILSLVLAFTFGSRGIVTFFVWFSTWGKALFTREVQASVVEEPLLGPDSQQGEGSSFGFFDEDITNLRPQLNHELRREIIYYAVIGITKSVNRANITLAPSGYRRRDGVAYNRIQLSREHEHHDLRIPDPVKHSGKSKTSETSRSRRGSRHSRRQSRSGEPDSHFEGGITSPVRRTLSRARLPLDPTNSSQVPSAAVTQEGPSGPESAQPAQYAHPLRHKFSRASQRAFSRSGSRRGSFSQLDGDADTAADVGVGEREKARSRANSRRSVARARRASRRMRTASGSDSDSESSSDSDSSGRESSRNTETAGTSTPAPERRKTLVDTVREIRKEASNSSVTKSVLNHSSPLLKGVSESGREFDTPISFSSASPSFSLSPPVVPPSSSSIAINLSTVENGTPANPIIYEQSVSVEVLPPGHADHIRNQDETLPFPIETTFSEQSRHRHQQSNSGSSVSAGTSYREGMLKGSLLGQVEEDEGMQLGAEASFFEGLEARVQAKRVHATPPGLDRSVLLDSGSTPSISRVLRGTLGSLNGNSDAPRGGQQSGSEIDEETGLSVKNAAPVRPQEYKGSKLESLRESLLANSYDPMQDGLPSQATNSSLNSSLTGSLSGSLNGSMTGFGAKEYSKYAALPPPNNPFLSSPGFTGIHGPVSGSGGSGVPSLGSAESIPSSLPGFPLGGPSSESGRIHSPANASSSSDNDGLHLFGPRAFLRRLKRSLSNVPIVSEVIRLLSTEEDDHEFIDFAPEHFARMRALSNISSEEYLHSLASTQRERFSEGASGAFMYYTACNQYIVKTMSGSECEVLLRILPQYVAYMASHPHSLITRFYGCHALKLYGTTVYFVVMRNFLNSDGATIHEKFDLKGSWVGRHHVPLERGQPAECKHCGTRYRVGMSAASSSKLKINKSNAGKKGSYNNSVRYNNRLLTENKEDMCPARPNTTHEPNQTLRDADWNYKLRLAADTAQALGDMIVRDSEFLRRLNIMDYSLLLGIHRNKYRLVDVQEDPAWTKAPNSVQSTSLDASMSLPSSSRRPPPLHMRIHSLSGGGIPPRRLVPTGTDAENSEMEIENASSARSRYYTAGSPLLPSYVPPSTIMNSSVAPPSPMPLLGTSQLVSSYLPTPRLLAAPRQPFDRPGIALSHVDSLVDMQLPSVRPGETQEVSLALSSLPPLHDRIVSQFGSGENPGDQGQGQVQGQVQGQEQNQNQSLASTRNARLAVTSNQLSSNYNFSGSTSARRHGIQLRMSPDHGPVTPFFATHKGGLKAVIVEGPGLYFMGIIDILQEYTWNKRIERWFKTRVLFLNRDGLSSIDPDRYAARFRQRVIAQLIDGYERVEMEGIEEDHDFY